MSRKLLGCCASIADVTNPTVAANAYAVPAFLQAVIKTVQ